jgi:hypothetical protein
MTPLTALALADGLVSMLEKLAPEISALVAKGEISVEQQSALDVRVMALRPGGVAFAGPEWRVDA